MKTRFFIKITFVVLIGVLLIMSYLVYNKSPIYYFDTSAPYQYDFDKTHAIIYDLDIINNRIILPCIDGNDTSTFLKIEVKSNFLGEFFQPSITLISGDIKTVNYFEYGAKHTRYINISSFINSNVSEIKIESNGMSINNQKTELNVFHNITVDKKKILIIAPHPDDAEIAAYGLYAKNKNSYIVTITAGDSGPFNYDEVYKDTISHYLQKGKLRTWNSLTIPLLGGTPYQNIINLGFFDETLEEMKQKDSLPVKSIFSKTSDINTFRKQNISNLKNGLSGDTSWKSLVNNLNYLLDTIKPELIVCPYPSIDSHLDHKYSTIAIIEALQKSKVTSGYLLLYTNHHPLSESYPYGKSGDPVNLPPNFNNELYFTSIYSNAVSASLQQDKFFALEAMNDLRLDTEWQSIKGSIKIALKNIKRKFLGPQIDYYRRAVRANELFFIIPVSDIYNNEKLKKITE